MELHDERRGLTERLHILDAMVMALDRREELMRLVGESASADEAMRRLQVEWGLARVQAIAALDLQVRRFSTRERALMAGERDRLRQQLRDLMD